MTQLRIDVRTPAARATDPVTSHMAAENLTQSGVRCKQQAEVLSAIWCNEGCTAHELAKRTGLDYYKIMRRGAELRLAGVVKENRFDKRRCTVSGRMALTWWPKEN